MIQVIIEEKPQPNEFVLKITSSTLEEKIFLSALYDRRVPVAGLRENADGTVTVEITY